MNVETRFDFLAYEIDEVMRRRAAAEAELHTGRHQSESPLGRLQFSLVPVLRGGHCAHSISFAQRRPLRPGRRDDQR